MENLYWQASTVLKEILKEKFTSLKIPSPLWEVPRREFGDLATPVALKIASLKGEDANLIAQHIAQDLQEKMRDNIEELQIVSGFINIFFSQDALREFLKSILEKDKEIFQFFPQKRILLEFVSANPTGPLSIAHGRQAVVGDVLANLYEFLGQKVIREYYINDVGRQIELLVESVRERIKEERGDEFKLPEEGYLGEYVKEIARQALEKNPPDLKRFIISSILEKIREDLKKIGVNFTSWVSQERLIKEKKVERAIEILKERNFVYEKDGALWFSSTKFGDDKDRVLRKSDGEFTYFACDIAYHEDKITRGFDQLVNLWGPDHHGYIRRVKNAFKALGFDEEILNIVVVQLVSLKSKEKMSKRKGKFFLLSDLVDDVGKDAARFYYLTRKNSSHLEFDLEKAKEISFDNPLYYIQYAHARINSILKRIDSEDVDFNYIAYLEEKEERELLRELIRFPFCLERIYYFLEPVFLIEYLKELASLFHKFYEGKKVIGEERKKMYARLLLLKGVKKILIWGLNILGIKPKERM